MTALDHWKSDIDEFVPDMLSVRSGGHNMAGYGTNDGGLVIDLSHMKALVMATSFAPQAADAGPARVRTQPIWQALRPSADGVYVNFLEDEGERRVHEAYPKAAYARLAALKKRSDPTNLLRLNQHIPPARTDLLAT